MADLVLILIIALVLLWLFHSLSLGNLFGGSANAAAPYIKEIGTAAHTAIQDIQKAGGGTAQSLGKLAQTVESNLFNGFASAAKHSTFSVPSSTTYEKAVQSQLYPGVITGENAVTGPASSIGAGAGSAVISVPASFWQGLSSSAQAADTLPAVHSIVSGAENVGSSIWHGLESAGSSAVHGVDSAGSYLAKQASNVSNWVGHLF